MIALFSTIEGGMPGPVGTSLGLVDVGYTLVHQFSPGNAGRTQLSQAPRPGHGGYISGHLGQDWLHVLGLGDVLQLRVRSPGPLQDSHGGPNKELVMVWGWLMMVVLGAWRTYMAGCNMYCMIFSFIGLVS